MAITYERLRQPSDTDLDQIGVIYEENFPPEEKVPYEGLRFAMARDTDDFPTLIARDTEQAHRVAGVIWTPRLGTTPYFFLPYFAVDKAYHGQGIGSELLQQAVAYLASLPHSQTLLWEVDPPIPNDPSHNNNRRIRFYERNGAHLVAYSTPFAMPDMTDETGVGIVPMRIMYAPIGNSQLPNDKQQAYEWIDAIYTNDYTEYPELRERVLRDILALA